MRLLVSSFFILIFAFVYNSNANEEQLNKGYDYAAEGKYLKAFDVWKPLAEQGNAWAQYSLGVMYRDGLGVPENDTLAEKWTRLSAEQGNRVAAYNLGIIYQLGYGVEIDFVEAMKWFDLASLHHKLIDDVFERTRSIRSSDLVCENKDICKYAYRVYRKASAIGNVNAMIYISNILFALPEKKYLTDAIMWSIIAQIKGINDPILKEYSPKILASLKETNNKEFLQAQRLSKICLDSNFKDCGFYDQELWDLNDEIKEFLIND